MIVTPVHEWRHFGLRAARGRDAEAVAHGLGSRQRDPTPKENSSIRKDTSTYVGFHTCIYIYIYIYIHTYVHTSINKNIYIYIYTHTRHKFNRSLRFATRGRQRPEEPAVRHLAVQEAAGTPWSRTDAENVKM